MYHIYIWFWYARKDGIKMKNLDDFEHIDDKELERQFEELSDDIAKILIIIVICVCLFAVGYFIYTLM